MNPLRFLWRFLRLLLHTLTGIWISLTIPRRKTVDGERLPEPEPISRWSRRLLDILGVKLHCHGQPPHNAAMIVANHLSWLDIPVISACTHAAFLSKESIRHWPVIGWFARASSTVFIRRGKGEAKEVAAAIAARLRGGRQLAIFPEGRVGDGNGVQRFFPRLFSAAIDTHTPVVPMALRYSVKGKPDPVVLYTPEKSFLGILCRVLARRGSVVDVWFCPPLSPEGKDRRTLAREAREAIQAALSSGAVD
jgi:1-acyl-sn-glycerol-3-phosphate acyltransferase